jgi:hypothetical protein
MGGRLRGWRQPVPSGASPLGLQGSPSVTGPPLRTQFAENDCVSGLQAQRRLTGVPAAKRAA